MHCSLNFVAVVENMLFYIIVVVHWTDGAPQIGGSSWDHRHRHDHHHHRVKPEHKGTLDVNLHQLDSTLPVAIAESLAGQPPSQRVAFSPYRPGVPPLGVPGEMDDDLLWRNLEADRTIDGKPTSSTEATIGSSRTKRHAPNGPHILPVCRATSRWLNKTHLRDQNGVRFEVVPMIDVDGVRLTQWFFETRCQHAGHSCTGIDTSRFQSLCQEREVLVYAKVRDSEGGQGWRLVSIPGACECKLVPLTVNTGVFIELLRRARSSNIGRRHP